MTGNSDKPPSYLGSSQHILQSPLLIAWFAENLDFHHPRVRLLPIGLENKEYGGLGKSDLLSKLIDLGIPSIYQPNKEDHMDRPILSYINFMVRTGSTGRPERQEALRLLANIGYLPNERLSPYDYTSII